MIRRYTMLFSLLFVCSTMSAMEQAQPFSEEEYRTFKATLYVASFMRNNPDLFPPNIRPADDHYLPTLYTGKPGTTQGVQLAFHGNSMKLLSTPWGVTAWGDIYNPDGKGDCRNLVAHVISRLRAASVDLELIRHNKKNDYRLYNIRAAQGIQLPVAQVDASSHLYLLNEEYFVLNAKNCEINKRPSQPLSEEDRAGLRRYRDLFSLIIEEKDVEAKTKRKKLIAMLETYLKETPEIETERRKGKREIYAYI